MALVKGARGVEMVPNLTFWQEVIASFFSLVFVVVILVDTVLTSLSLFVLFCFFLFCFVLRFICCTVAGLGWRWLQVYGRQSHGPRQLHTSRVIAKINKTKQNTNIQNHPRKHKHEHKDKLKREVEKESFSYVIFGLFSLFSKNRKETAEIEEEKREKTMMVRWRVLLLALLVAAVVGGVLLNARLSARHAPPSPRPRARSPADSRVQAIVGQMRYWQHRAAAPVTRLERATAPASTRYFVFQTWQVCALCACIERTRYVCVVSSVMSKMLV